MMTHRTLCGALIPDKRAVTLPVQEELVKSATFRYITDAITPDEALAILKAKEATKGQREATVRSQGCVWR